MKSIFSIKFFWVLMANICMSWMISGTCLAQAEIDSEGYLSPVEKEVVAELNLARSNPKLYASFLEERKKLYVGKLIKEPGKINLMTEEGVRPVEEAIEFLKKQEPLKTLTASIGLSKAAKDHAKDTGPSGVVGHTGKDGSSMDVRMSRYGEWLSTCAENISYGEGNGRSIVIQLIVDDGVASRGHRKNIFNKDLGKVGVAVGPHKIYKMMCVMDFAGDYQEGKK